MGQDFLDIQYDTEERCQIFYDEGENKVTSAILSKSLEISF